MCYIYRPLYISVNLNGAVNNNVVGFAYFRSHLILLSLQFSSTRKVSPLSVSGFSIFTLALNMENANEFE